MSAAFKKDSTCCKWKTISCDLGLRRIHFHLVSEKKDFVGPIQPASVGMKLQGIAKGVSVMGQGHVAWSFVDTTGMLRTLKIPALYVPKANARLLSTCSLLTEYPEETISINCNRLLLSGTSCGNNDKHKHNSIEVLTDRSTNLPVAHAYSHNTDTAIHQAMNSTISTVSRSNMNLSEPQKELLRWHYRLGHLSFRRVQSSDALWHPGTHRKRTPFAICGK